MADSPHEGRGDERKITRRDFLDGVAISAAGLAAAAASPSLTGAEAALLEQPAAAARLLPADRHRHHRPARQRRPRHHAHRRQAEPARIRTRPTAGPGIHPRHVRDVDDRYDLVVVGAGASGLAAAKWYQDRFGPDAQDPAGRPAPRLRRPLAPQRVPHPRRDQRRRRRDAAAQRRHREPRLDRHLEQARPTACSTSPAPTASRRSTCSTSAASTPNNFPSTAGPGIPATYGLRPMLLFPKRGLGHGHARAGTKQATPDLGRLPRDDAVLARRPGGHRADHRPTTTPDWISLKHGPKTDQEKKAILARITYKRYLMDYVGVNEEATSYFQRTSHGLFGAGIQAVQAGDTWALEEAGFAGLGLEPTIFPGIGRTAQQDMDRERRPDARLAGRQHVAAAPARLQADPERDGRRRRRAARTRRRS